MSLTTTIASSSRSIVGPLTTTFTMPSSCTNAYGVSSVVSSAPTFYVAASCTGAGDMDHDYNCYPPYQRSLEGWAFAPFSPGLYCPSGYTTACSAALLPDGRPSFTSEAQNVDVQYVFDGLLAGETGAGCCPVSFTCMADAMNVPHCLSIGLAGSVVATMCDPSVEGMASPTETFTAPLFTTITNIMTTTWPDSDASTIPETSTSLIGYLSVAAPMFRLYWKASDRPRTSSPEEHPTITAGPTTNRSSTISSPTSVSEPLPILNGGLTTGTKTAIGVVVPLVVIGTAAAISALLFRRRKRAYQERTWIDYDKPELDASNAKKSTLNGELIAELPTESRVEARAIDREGLGNDNPHELPVPSLMHELSDS